MNKTTSFFQIATMLLALFSQATLLADAAAAEEAYLLQPGDVIEISVWKEEGLNKAVLLRPDGGISFPLAGDIMAAGKSVSDLELLVSERISKFIPDPAVTVSINQLTGNVIYVIGKVTRSGEITAKRYIDVVQALSLAGGMTPYAAANKIKILRRKNGRMISIPFRYGDIEKGEDLEQNIILQSGDVVVVP